jgi:hypothetical protein
MCCKNNKLLATFFNQSLKTSPYVNYRLKELIKRYKCDNRDRSENKNYRRNTIKKEICTASRKAFL